MRNPARDLPIGILGSLSIVTVCYVLMSAALVMMVPYNAIDVLAPFSSAFAAVGLPWAKYIVALGALCGIVTGVLVSHRAIVSNRAVRLYAARLVVFSMLPMT